MSETDGYLIIAKLSIWVLFGASFSALVISLYPLWEAWRDWRVVKTLPAKDERQRYVVHVFRSQVLKVTVLLLLMTVGAILAFSTSRSGVLLLVTRLCMILIPSLLAIDAWFENRNRRYLNRKV